MLLQEDTSVFHLEKKSQVEFKGGNLLFNILTPKLWNIGTECEVRGQ